MSGKRPVVLFLCTANSVRSQMAEAFLRAIGKDRFEVHSAGLVPASEINPLTRQVMAEIGHDLAGQRPKALKEYFAKFVVDYVIFVCNRAEKDCPFLWPTALRGISWPFEDPAVCSGSVEERIQAFRGVRDQIEKQIRNWVDEYDMAVTGKTESVHRSKEVR